MTKIKQRDPDMPVGKLTRIEDDLPSPEELARPIRSVKVTIILNQASVDFFKKQATIHHTKYQKMMRAVIDRYVARYEAA